MISIVIPLYNKERYIEKTLNSVLRQSFGNFEIILVDDGSTDQSINLINKFKDDRVKVISIENSGVSNARNVGIRNAKYDWIALLDADDIWDGIYLEKVVEVINNNSLVNIISTNYYKCYRNNSNVVAFDLQSGIITSYLAYNTLTSSSAIIHKSVFNEVGGFNIDIKYGEDQDMWLRASLKYDIFFISEPLVFYNLSDHFQFNLDYSNRVLRNDFLWHIDSIDNNSIVWLEYKNLYLLKNLKPYYVCDNHLNAVLGLLDQVLKMPILYRIFYSCPRVLIKPLYLLFFKLRYS